MKVCYFPAIFKLGLIAVVSVGLITPAGASADSATAATTERPNILVIVSDDQGFGDTGFQGCQDISTPNLDALAKAGLRCTNGYVSHPFCSPSRAGLMTGRYQARFGHEHNPRYDPSDHREGLPLSEKILPQFLKSAGYVTGWIGKWHLGAAPEFLPQNRGFMETFGFIGGAHQYLNWQPDPKAEYRIPIVRDGNPVEVKEHLTVAFGHEAADFVSRHNSQPWFLYLAFNAPHAPLQPTAERLARFAAIKDKTRRAYAAQVSLLDDAIGETLDALRRTGQSRRTLVFFFSDNGAPLDAGPNGGSNLPLRGGKHTVYEGGIHVPFLVCWPDQIRGGRVYTQVVSSLDVFATALACAGVPMPADRPYDSVNLLPFLTGKTGGSPHDRLFWRMDAAMGGNSLQAAVRDGDNKLVRIRVNPDQLFDLSTDLGETRNLANSQPQTLTKLNGFLDAWFSQMAKHIAFPGQQGPEKEWPERYPQ
jgi:arylsulfatase A-like enzyme